MNKKIFIFGSKPNTQIPNEKCDLILSANGGAYYAKKYLENFPETYHINIVTDQGFIKIKKLRDIIEKSMPSKIIFRGDRIDLKKHSFILSSLNSVKIDYFGYFQQFIFQKRLFQMGLLNLILGEFHYEKTLLKKISYLIKCIKSKIFLGTSTGLFTTLYALDKYPDSKVFLYGITINGGVQFYNINEKNKYKHKNRYNVDRYLYDKLKKIFKNEIYFID